MAEGESFPTGIQEGNSTGREGAQQGLQEGNRHLNNSLG